MDRSNGDVREWIVVSYKRIDKKQREWFYVIRSTTFLDVENLIRVSDLSRIGSLPGVSTTTFRELA